MNTIKHVRIGYRLLGGRSHSRDTHGIPTITVEEIGRVAEAIGEAAALVYACAVAGPAGSHYGYSNGLARDLVNIGPWSFAADAWTSREARQIIADTIDSDKELARRASDALVELANY